MKKYLKFYERCMKTGVLPEESIEGYTLYSGSNGLCNSVDFDDDNAAFHLFEPTHEEMILYRCPSRAYWAWDGVGLNSSHFGPTRQNIVLFLAAMNNEL
jgi:hypothetical protein